MLKTPGDIENKTKPCSQGVQMQEKSPSKQSEQCDDGSEGGKQELQRLLA